MRGHPQMALFPAAVGCEHLDGNRAGIEFEQQEDEHRHRQHGKDGDAEASQYEMQHGSGCPCCYAPRKACGAAVPPRATCGSADPDVVVMVLNGRMGIDAMHLLAGADEDRARSEEHTSELQSLMRISYAV